ncbi:MAG TPA: hypothetical protein VGP07_20870 [Polyangia bacterium]|jgi:hypothetical protein
MRLVLLAALVASSCAAPERRADSPAVAAAPAPRPAPARIKDSVPERSAALNDADRDLQSEAGERRWGLEEARQRREDSRQADGGVDGKLVAPVPGALGSTGSLIPSSTTR